jgi:hypothetical protein
MRFLHGLKLPIPRIFQHAAGVALNSLLRQAFKARPLDLEEFAPARRG